MDKIQKIKDHIAKSVNNLEKKLAKKKRALDDAKNQVDFGVADLPEVLFRDSGNELKKYETF